MRPVRGARHPLAIGVLLLLLGGSLGGFLDGRLGGALNLERAAAKQDPIHAELREFFPTGKYTLFISGRQQTGSRIYHSRRAGAFLVTGSDYGRALLIEPKKKTVSAVHDDSVAQRPDKGVDVVASAKVEPLGNFSVSRGDVVISAPGLRARLRPQQYLLGIKSADDMILHTPEYERNGTSYRPGAAELRKLQASQKDVVVRVYFGTWCHTCTRLLPRILRVDKALRGSAIKFEYYGLPKGARAMARDPLARRNNIKRIPTGLVTVGGRPAGRINSTQFARPEVALCNLILRN